MPRRPARSSAGFTLLELLIALALFGLIAVALSSGLRFAGHAIPEEQRRRAAFADLDTVRNVLRRMIAEARTIEGSEDRIDFAGSLPRALATPGLYAIRVATIDDRLILVWRALPEAEGQEPGEPLGEAELARNIVGLDLAFLTPSGNGAPVWRPTVGDKVIPLLVRARLRLPQGDPRHWPELVVAPGIDTVGQGQQ